MRSSQPESRRVYLSEDAQAVIDADFEEIAPTKRYWWHKLKERWAPLFAKN
jgi:hypothetical protein